MSNVLIGIIGVILFIGLALAGALILGDDFKSANNDTKAAAAQQQLKQVADAVAMSTLKIGSAPRAQYVDAASPLIPRFLRSVPVNPVRPAGSTFLLLDAGGALGAGAEAKTAVMYLNADEPSRSVCETIDRLSGRTPEGTAFDTGAKSFAATSITAQTGCMSNGSAYIVFHKL